MTLYKLVITFRQVIIAVIGDRKGREREAGRGEKGWGKGGGRGGEDIPIESLKSVANF